MTPQEMQASGVGAPEEMAMPPRLQTQQPPAPPSGPEQQLLATQAARSLFGLSAFERPKALIRLRDKMPGLYPMILDELDRLQVNKFAPGK